MSVSKLFRSVVQISLIGLLAACAARQKDNGYLPNPLLIATTEDYTQPASGLHFSTDVATFRRESIQQHNADASDLDIRYRDRNQFGGVIVTLHVFPPSGRYAGVGSDARGMREFEWRKNEVARMNKDVKLVAEQTVTLRQNGVDQPGRMASFVYEGLYDQQRLPVVTRIYVFAADQGRWMIDYQFTYPAAFDADKSIEQFMKSLRWTFNPPA